MVQAGASADVDAPRQFEAAISPSSTSSVPERAETDAGPDIIATGTAAAVLEKRTVVVATPPTQLRSVSRSA